MNVDKRYTFWSGLLGGMFLALSYFGTDQSQVQRYISGTSLRESRLGLMFNAVCKIPMQFFILLLGVLVFVFYQFEQPPVYFNKVVWNTRAKQGDTPAFRAIETKFGAAHAREKTKLKMWIDARELENPSLESAARKAVVQARANVDAIRKEARLLIDPRDNSKDKAKDSDYVFITFILDYLPHGVIGLLITVFFAAALSAKAAELNALSSTTIVDFYKHIVKRDATDAHYVKVSRWLTLFWGLVAIGFALFANMTENLIQASNIPGSVFNCIILGVFIVAFFMKWIGGSAVFWGGLAAQALVFFLFYTTKIGYLWFNVIGCVACVIFSIVLQVILPSSTNRSNSVSAAPA